MNWPEDLKLIYQWSNFIIAISYFAIPILLAILYWKKRAVAPSSWITLCFIFFILFCGLTHANEVLVFYFAAYRFYTLAYLLTSIFSAITVILLPVAMKKIIAFKSPEEYEAIISECQAGLKERDVLQETLTETNKQLQGKVEELLRRIDEKDWYIKTHEEIRDLQRILLQNTTAFTNSQHVESGKPC
jgi:hypothetical protein